jgi:signal peptidase I
MKFVLDWGGFLVVVVAAWLLAGPAHLGGPASYVIVDGRSMEPTYSNGDLVVALDRDEYAIGDVIVYDAPIEAQFEVIHRVIERVEGGYVTQGDNRDRPDGWLAPDETILGSAVFHVPNGGAVVNFLRQPAAGLGLLAGMIAFQLLKRTEQQSKDDEGDGPDGGVQPGSDAGQSQVDPDEGLESASLTTVPCSTPPARHRGRGRMEQRHMLLDPPAVVGALVGLSAARYSARARGAAQAVLVTRWLR